MSENSAELARKKKELERLCSEYIEHMDGVIDTFTVIVALTRQLTKYGAEGMQVGLDIMPRILQAQQAWAKAMQAGQSATPN